MAREFELDPAKNPALTIWVGTQTGNLYLFGCKHSNKFERYHIVERRWAELEWKQSRIDESKPYNELSPKRKQQFAKEATPELLKMFLDYYEKPTNQFEQIKPDEWIFINYNNSTNLYLMLESRWLDLKGNRLNRVKSYRPNDIKTDFSFDDSKQKHNGMTFWQDITCYYWLSLPEDINKQFKRENPELYQHFEQYYQQNPVAPAAVKPNWADWVVLGNLKDYDFTHFDGVMHIYPGTAMGEKLIKCYNWQTGRNQLRSDVRGRVAYKFDQMPKEWVKSAYLDNPRLAQRFETAYQLGSDYDIDKKRCGCGLSFCPDCENFNFAVNERTKSEQERMSDLSVTTFGPAVTDWLNSHTNSPNNQQINEKFNLPTKIRSFPRGERLTSSIIQSPRGKIAASKGYSINGAAIIPGRRPVRGR